MGVPAQTYLSCEASDPRGRRCGSDLPKSSHAVAPLAGQPQSSCLLMETRCLPSNLLSDVASL